MKNIGFIFAGQGSQNKGMLREIYENTTIGQEILKKANEITGMDILELSMSDESRESTEYLQPLIYVTNYILYKIAVSKTKVYPSVMAGHSLGEYSALACSGAIGFEDGLKLVMTRGKIMKDVCRNIKSGMLAVKSNNIKEIESMAESIGTLDIACINDEDQAVFAGKDDDINAFADMIPDFDCKKVRLKTEGAFHSRLFATAAEVFRNEVGKYEYRMPSCDVISNIMGREFRSVEEIKNELVNQMFSTVRWSDGVKTIEERVDLVIEIGVKTTLLNTFHNIPAYNYTAGMNILNKLSDYRISPLREMLCFAIRECVCVRFNKGNEELKRLEEIYEELNYYLSQADEGDVGVEIDTEELANIIHKIYGLKGIDREDKDVRLYSVAKNQLCSSNYDILIKAC